MLMASAARSSTPQLLLFLYAGCVLLVMSSNAPWHVAAAANSPFSFSFDFSTISTSRLEDLQLEGDAAQHGKLVDLTCYSLTQRNPYGDCTGGMVYAHPVPFYDSITGEVSSFTTQFTFAMGLNSAGGNEGGMAFFLSSYPSRLPPDSSGSGGNLGLPGNDGLSQAYGTDRFIAVEFDTLSNTWDPRGTQDHIGIDINTVSQSVNTTGLPTFSLNGSMTASITFDSNTKMLVASLQFDDRPSVGPVEVSTMLPDPVTSLLPSEVAIGFSAATGESFQLHQILSWSFNSTLATHAGFSHRRWRFKSDSFVLGTTGLGRFEHSELARATNDFSEKSKLGVGAFGAVYKGCYKDKEGRQLEVAVKKIKQTEGRDFSGELKTISATRHMNLVELKGWCCSRDNSACIGFCCCGCRQKVKRFLVYELVPNGDLEYHLKNVLPWEKRYKIAKGIGSAITYLHHGCKRCILHRDIKPSNILLDDEFNPKLGDFGLSRITGKDSTMLMTTAIGTLGYMDPQCIKDGEVEYNCRSDVYSFGIVLLEIACGKKPREQIQLEELRSTGTEAQFVENVADDKLNGDYNRTEMQRLIFLGLRCSHPVGQQRPYMKDAMKYLEDGIELPAITERQSHQGAYGTICSDEQALMSPGAVSSFRRHEWGYSSRHIHRATTRHDQDPVEPEPVRAAAAATGITSSQSLHVWPHARDSAWTCRAGFSACSWPVKDRTSRHLQVKGDGAVGPRPIRPSLSNLHRHLDLSYRAIVTLLLSKLEEHEYAGDADQAAGTQPARRRSRLPWFLAERHEEEGTKRMVKGKGNEKENAIGKEKEKGKMKAKEKSLSYLIRQESPLPPPVRKKGKPPKLIKKAKDYTNAPIADLICRVKKPPPLPPRLPNRTGAGVRAAEAAASGSATNSEMAHASTMV
ncbi:L-type lectin-domain containing receptor kinase IX.2-like [Triticum urartu]|uniref:L-type lectin-domain containing receptor kinase IX.2-like n=1 Tax=Triticum urartu TaxID=4572 RepID=UPI00204377D3|nr:L-type lectin-domain containing receptor kinase IX.2-like [Triticum urartu]